MEDELSGSPARMVVKPEFDQVTTVEYTGTNRMFPANSDVLSIRDNGLYLSTVEEFINAAIMMMSNADDVATKNLVKM